MQKKEQALNNLLSQKLLPLFYHQSETVSIEILKALYNAGIKVVEYTNRGESALSNFAAMKAAVEKDMPEMQLGIGTIKNGLQAQHFIDAGADFIVCPTINDKVASVTYNAGLLWVPGCMTPTEISQAEQLGASLVKLFPGNILGPGYVSAIKELFPDVKFMPTGGVEAEESNLKSWFSSGVVAVGMGSKLISKQLIESKDYKGIEKLTTDALNLIQSITK